jgi:hypothetical protein
MTITRTEQDSNISTTSNETTNSTASAQSETKEHQFTSRDFDFLSANSHERYLPNRQKVGHALITANADEGVDTALQFNIPVSPESDAPRVRPLLKIETSYPKLDVATPLFKAETPGGTKMYAKRFIDIELSDKNKTIPLKLVCFSPTKTGKHIFSDVKEKDVTWFRGNIDKKVAKDLKEIKPAKKGKGELILDPESVKKRTEVKARMRSQNAVMSKGHGPHSAKNEYELFLNKMKSSLTPKLVKQFKRAINAPLNTSIEGNYRPEWLHAYGYQLTPLSQNPQVAGNLGAGPKWSNTEMLILERIAQWFAINRPHAIEKINSEFEMLLNTDIIKKIVFELSIEENERSVKIKQNIDTFNPFPTFHKASDIAQATAVAYNLLHDVEAESSLSVQNDKGKSKKKSASHNQSFTLFKASPKESKPSSVEEAIRDHRVTSHHKRS